MAISSDKKRFASDVIIRAAAELFSGLRGLVFLPIIAKQLGTEQFGIYTQINVVATLLSPILTMRLDIATVRYLSGIKDREQISSTVGTVFYFHLIILSFVVGVGCLCAKPLSTLLFGSEGKVSYALLLCLFVALRAPIFLLQYQYRAIGRIKAFSIAEILMFAGQMSAVVLAVLVFKLNVEGMLLFLCGAYLLSLFGLFLHLNYIVGIPFVFHIKTLKKYLKYSLPLVPNSVCGWVLNLSDRVMISWILGLSQVGIYSASYLLGNTLSIIYLPFTFVVFPSLAASWNNSKIGTFRSYVTSTIYYYLMLALPAALLITITGPYLINLLASKSFETSRMLLLLITLGISFIGIGRILIFLIHISEKTIITVTVVFISAIINIGINLIFIPRIGIIAAALSTFIAYVAEVAICIYFVKKLFPQKILVWPPIWKLALSTAPLLAMFYLPAPESLAAFIAYVLLGLSGYVLVLLAVKGIGRKEFELLSELLKPIKSMIGLSRV